MSKPTKKNRIKKSDYSRVLTTETVPFETPIIFSNDGFRHQVHKTEDLDEITNSVIECLIMDKDSQINHTIPFQYKIKKNSTELRRLSVLHPASQWKMALFYKKYERLILYFNSLSPISIRAPSKIAGSYFTKTSWENINQYKDKSVSLIETDRFSKHSPSFFSYRGHDRLYKFFQSPDYFHLERQFDVLRTLDVAKCFDSIYTHCLSWATKDKQFTKDHVSILSTFAQDFDLLIRQANFGETNGIAIGPEISRIFAEIIFQRVDINAINELHKSGWQLGRDYEIRRYVDDVFIFTSDETLAKSIYEIYSDALLTFNLHVNSTKSTVLHRPFVTKKSKITKEITDTATSFFEKFLVDGGNGTLKPLKIHRGFGLARSFIEAIKTTCAANSAKYDEVSSYLVSVITERVKKLVNVDEVKTLAEQENYRDAVMILLEVQFFLYVVAPSVSASYKLCTSIVIICRFCRLHLALYEETIIQWVYEISEPLFVQQPSSQWASIDGMISLELINILLALRELGDRHLLPLTVIKSLFGSERKLSYFDVISCLFYIRREARYKTVRIKVHKAIDQKLAHLNDLKMDSEKAHLFLDLLSCPYVHNRSKRKWISKFRRAMSLPPLSKSEVTSFLASSKPSWFVNWDDLDLLNSLEKKELKRAY